MTKTVKWIVSGLAAVVVAGAVYAVPVLAEERSPRMMSGRMMAGPMGMMEMHSLMAPLMNEMPAMHNEMMPEIAKLFGMTAEELTQAVSEGKSMAQLAEEKGVAMGEVRAAMTRGMKTFLDRLVDEQKISKEQVGKLLGFMEKNMDNCPSGQGGMMNF